MQLVFASNNAGKILEVQNLINKSSVAILSLKDIQFSSDIPENKDTLEGNAVEKAAFLYQITGYNCLSDDSGLEVEALNGAPGAYSARYAGTQKNDLDNTNKLLNELENVDNRKARFRTIICLILNGEEYLFEGIVNGEISKIPMGAGGFGYDPVFIPKGYTKTFAQMSLEEKNGISHRAQAVQKLTHFLNSL